MSRFLSKLSVKINIGVYSVNFFVLIVACMLLLGATGNLLLYMLPGMFIAWLICLINPNFYNVVAGMLHLEQIDVPTAGAVWEQMGDIFNSAFNKGYSGVNASLPPAAFCAVLCSLVGIVCLFMQPKLLKTVESPMDWYKAHPVRTIIYSVFGLTYGISMCIGAFCVIFAKHPITGGFLAFAWFFAICGIAIVAGVVLLIIDRFFSVQMYDALSTEEQVALCEKQSKYMERRKRKKQVKRLGDKARFDPNGVTATKKQQEKHKEELRQEKRRQKREEKQRKKQEQVDSSTDSQDSD